MGAEPFKKKWPDTLKTACIAAVLEHGYSARQAGEAANRGELPGKGRDLEPWPVPLSTVAAWAQDARRLARLTEKAAESPADRLRHGLAELTALWERDVDKLRRRKRAVEPEEVARLAKAGRELEMMARGLHRAKTEGPAETDREQEDVNGGQSDFVGQLAQSEAAAKKNGARAGRSLGARSTSR